MVMIIYGLSMVVHYAEYNNSPRIQKKMISVFIPNQDLVTPVAFCTKSQDLECFHLAGLGGIAPSQ